MSEQSRIRLQGRPNDPDRPIMLTIETAGWYSTAHLSRENAKQMAKSLLKRANRKEGKATSDADEINVDAKSGQTAQQLAKDRALLLDACWRVLKSLGWGDFKEKLTQVEQAVILREAIEKAGGVS